MILWVNSTPSCSEPPGEFQHFSIPGSVQGEGLEQPGIGKGVPAHGMRWGWMGFKVQLKGSDAL